eukprot:762952-Hanusia_phi.AAC.1
MLIWTGRLGVSFGFNAASKGLGLYSVLYKPATSVAPSCAVPSSAGCIVQDLDDVPQEAEGALGNVQQRQHPHVARTRVPGNHDDHARGRDGVFTPPIPARLVGDHQPRKVAVHPGTDEVGGEGDPQEHKKEVPLREVPAAGELGPEPPGVPPTPGYVRGGRPRDALVQGRVDGVRHDVHNRLVPDQQHRVRGVEAGYVVVDGQHDEPNYQADKDEPREEASELRVPC